MDVFVRWGIYLWPSIGSKTAHDRAREAQVTQLVSDEQTEVQYDDDEAVEVVDNSRLLLSDAAVDVGSQVAVFAEDDVNQVRCYEASSRGGCEVVFCWSCRRGVPLVCLCCAADARCV